MATERMGREQTLSLDDHGETIYHTYAIRVKATLRTLHPGMEFTVAGAPPRRFVYLFAKAHDGQNIMLHCRHVGEQEIELVAPSSVTSVHWTHTDG